MFEKKTFDILFLCIHVEQIFVFFSSLLLILKFVCLSKATQWVSLLQGDSAVCLPPTSLSNSWTRECLRAFRDLEGMFLSTDLGQREKGTLNILPLLTYTSGFTFCFSASGSRLMLTAAPQRTQARPGQAGASLYICRACVLTPSRPLFKHHLQEAFSDPST